LFLFSQEEVFVGTAVDRLLLLSWSHILKLSFWVECKQLFPVGGGMVPISRQATGTANNIVLMDHV
jgi:hypothetical protein